MNLFLRIAFKLFPVFKSGFVFEGGDTAQAETSTETEEAPITSGQENADVEQAPMEQDYYAQTNFASKDQKDYFDNSRHDNSVDSEGKEIEPKPEEQENEETETETPEPTDKKPTEKEAEPKETETQKKPADVKPEDTKTEEDYLIKNEKGEISLDSEKIQKLIGGESDADLQTLFQQRALEPAKPGGKPAAPDPNAGKEPWEIQAEQEINYETSLRDNLYLGLEKFKEAFESNDGDANKAYVAAQTHLKGILDSHLKEKSFEYREKHYKSTMETETGIRSAAEFKAKSDSNHYVASGKVGSLKTLNDLVYGVGGRDVMNLYDIANPGKNLKGDALKSDLTKWYTEFTSKQGQLDYLVEIAQLRTLKKLWPHVVKQMRGNIKAEGRNKAESTTGKSGKFAAPGAAKKVDALNDYLNHGNEPIASV